MLLILLEIFPGIYLGPGDFSGEIFEEIPGGGAFEALLPSKIRPERPEMLS